MTGRSLKLRCGLAASSTAEARPPPPPSRGELAPGEPGLKGGAAYCPPAAVHPKLILHVTWLYLTEYITSHGGTLAGLSEKSDLVAAAKV